MSKPQLKIVGATVTATGVAMGSLFYWDYETCHPMRKIKYEPREALVRIHNLFVNQFPFLKGQQLSLEELSRYNGKLSPRRQTYFSAGGKIYDVSSSEMFASAYAQWAGKDATVALARMSLSSHDVNRTDVWKTLTKEEQKSLQSWLHYFDQKYWIQGQLKEYHCEAPPLVVDD